MDIFDIAGIKVFFEEKLDGGGSGFGQDFLDYIPRSGLSGRIAMEVCCGPGFIGFGLLATRQCEQLILCDVNEQSLECCRKTVTENGLGERVRIFRSDGVATLPRELCFNLVVGNPPHYRREPQRPPFSSPLIWLDKDWTLHQRLYAELGPRLPSNGRVVMQENAAASTLNDFEPMIAGAGLAVYDCSVCRSDPGFYYIVSGPLVRSGDRGTVSI
jgi:16S rRNA G966 N2-methylase RsmD